MSFPYDILGKFLPDSTIEVIRELDRKRQQQLIGQTPEPLQTVIIILQQGTPGTLDEPLGYAPLGKNPPPGTMELRRPLSPLPKNGFQI